MHIFRKNSVNFDTASKEAAALHQKTLFDFSKESEIKTDQRFLEKS